MELVHTGSLSQVTPLPSPLSTGIILIICAVVLSMYTLSNIRWVTQVRGRGGREGAETEEGVGGRGGKEREGREEIF